MTGTKRKAGRKTIDLPNVGKVLFPGDGITKRDLADYYRGVAGLSQMTCWSQPSC